MAKIKGLNPTSIFVEDAPETVDFYVTRLGFTVEELSQPLSMVIWDKHHNKWALPDRNATVRP